MNEASNTTKRLSIPPWLQHNMEEWDLKASCENANYIRRPHPPRSGEYNSSHLQTTKTLSLPGQPGTMAALTLLHGRKGGMQQDCRRGRRFELMLSPSRNGSESRAATGAGEIRRLRCCQICAAGQIDTSTAERNSSLENTQRG